MSAERLREQCHEERAALQKRIPSNCHAIVIIVEEHGFDKRTVVYSSTTTMPDFCNVLGTIVNGVMNAGPF